MDERYQERRAGIERFFADENRIADSVKVAVSPSGRFRLETCRYITGPESWNYSRGIATRLSDGRVMADIKRNFGHFWHAWVEHPNGGEYLLCGEDYQGYSVLNLDTGALHVHFPESGYDGWGFCWTRVHPSPDRLVLAVEGCHWACPYDVVFCDFRTPEALPLPELGKITNQESCEGWADNETFVVNREIEVRKSDGAPYESLSEEEQSALDGDASLTESRIETVHFRRRDL